MCCALLSRIVFGASQSRDAAGWSTPTPHARYLNWSATFQPKTVAHETVRGSVRGSMKAHFKTTSFVGLRVQSAWCEPECEAPVWVSGHSDAPQ